MEFADLVHADAVARKAAPAGTTVASLTAKGAAALTDAELKTLLVGKAMWVQQHRDRRRNEGALRRDGNAIALYVGKRAPLPSEIGRPARRCRITRYRRRTRSPTAKSSRCFGNTPFEMTLYKVGDNTSARAATSSATRTTNTRRKVPPIWSISAKPRRNCRRIRHPSCMPRSEPARSGAERTDARSKRRNHAATGHAIGRGTDRQAHCANRSSISC